MGIGSKAILARFYRNGKSIKQVTKVGEAKYAWIGQVSDFSLVSNPENRLSVRSFLTDMMQELLTGRTRLT